MEGPSKPQRNIVHSLFSATIFLKGLNGIWEVAVGILLFYVKPATVYTMLRHASAAALGFSHGNAGGFMSQPPAISQSTQVFLAWYFLFYGLVNIFLVISLAHHKMWAYPVSMVFFSLFILYQIHRYFRFHSLLLLIFTIFDVFLVMMTFLEYRRLKAQALPKS